MNKGRRLRILRKILAGGVGVVALTSALSSCSSTASTPSAVSPEPATQSATPAALSGDCIATPQEYQAAWDQREARCVSPSLFGTTVARDATSLYPEGFAFAWAGSNTNLETYLELRKRDGDTPAKVGVGILSYVGFPGLESLDGETDLVVYTLPEGVQPVTPSIGAWARVFEERFGTEKGFPLKTQVALHMAYSGMGRDEDVVGAFESVTGCRRDDLLKGEELSASIGCKADFLNAIEAAGPSPYDAGNTESCVSNFASDYKGEVDAAAIRGVLYQCFDAGFLNTGVALGYNTYPNPMVCKPAAAQSVADRYTGREFVVPNTTIDALPQHVTIPLDIGKPNARAFLRKGYC